MKLVLAITAVEGPFWVMTTPGQDLDLYRADATWLHTSPPTYLLFMVVRLGLALLFIRWARRNLSIREPPIPGSRIRVPFPPFRYPAGGRALPSPPSRNKVSRCIKFARRSFF